MKVVLLILGLTLAVVAGILWFDTQQTKRAIGPFTGEDAEVISEKPVHWHATLTIVIDGQTQPIPASIGVGSAYADRILYDQTMGMTGVHTHDADGTIHWEIARGPFVRGQAKLKTFFDIWGQPFDRTHLLDRVAGTQGTVTMLVNGQANEAFEQYEVSDGDKIEIRFVSLAS